MFSSNVLQKKEGSAGAQGILLIKGHSAGIGDLLRSSAAWRSLRNHFPHAKLYLLFLTGEPGYPSEILISGHHLLDRFFAVKKRPKGFSEWRAFITRMMEILAATRPTLVVDCEPHGIRTSLIALFMRLKYGVRTVGIREVPLRGLFYNISSVSCRKFAVKRGLDFPLEYTNRDFVALSALGVERNGTPIELEETEEGARFRAGFRKKFGIPADAPLLGLNIGCGTPGALARRPDLSLVSAMVCDLQRRYHFAVILTGAAYEKQINEEFIGLHGKRNAHLMYDLAGKIDLLELTGVIKACDLFVTSDSGPYHMAVALRVPTVAIFNARHKVAYHNNPWVRCVVVTNKEELASAITGAEELIGSSARAETAS
jgi:ADP-heptose:LPS heptosyltransferase